MIGTRPYKKRAMTSGANHVVFTSRTQAGTLLSGELVSSVKPQTVIIGLSRGGVIVALPIADSLGLPIDVLAVKKIPSPSDPEYAIGALVWDGTAVVRWPEAQRSGADEAYMRDTEKRLLADLKRKEHWYRKFYPALSVRDKPVIIVDDGAATGLTVEAAVAWARKRHTAHVTVALPVAAKAIYRALMPLADACVVHTIPEDMSSVGSFYEHFPQVTDEEVAQGLAGGKKSG